MVRTKQPHSTLSPDSDSLTDHIIACVDLQKERIPLNHGKLPPTFADLDRAVRECGGLIVNDVSSSTILVATEAQYKRHGARVKAAVDRALPIVTFDWLAASLDSNAPVDCSPYHLHDSSTSNGFHSTAAGDTSVSSIGTPDAYVNSGSSSKRSINSLDTDDDGSENLLKKSKTYQPTLVPVDKEYPTKKCKVYQDGDGVFFDATLNQVDRGKNSNKFYRLQLIQHDDGIYYTWTRWGRVGESGQKKLLGDSSLHEAITEFEKKFRDKTGNLWINRSAPSKPKKYTMIEVQYSDDEADEDGAPSATPASPSIEIMSKLPKAVIRLMSFIFDLDILSNTMAELEYDIDKMPLGKLSKNTMLRGYGILQSLSDLMQTAGDEPDAIAVEALSNQFFTLIPHAFGRSTRPPLLDAMDKIQKEIDLLDNLDDIRASDDLMTKAKSQQAEKLALVDRQYQALGLLEMTPLDPGNTEFEQLETYLIKSAASTHNFTYQLQDIFRIRRRGEFERFDDSVYGYMFGKGVYLANLSTKSGNYCFSSSSENTGLLLLCEAELGTPSLKCTDADYRAPELAKEQGLISTHGIGATTPQAWKDAGCVHPDLTGVKMPDVEHTAPGASETGYLGLLYDEYIVYSVEQ
ncbi:uncharacterized protein HMPREF1541_04555 [Cyphellophora europaea CBS 101466]|uniref:Poly [ADP-ribose] polymerase n=1 Tax=Cyphellophora europaea (strain CBS 101466) TaxID=1220924 RepID=W2RX48_CYPE1|nr:uncharacterized protein HMPREF1541_04555 [Cyphellophora europaea CBS 101466]ETN40279.1 hypothetical protein HMPREF1541_04555 [Cyphellophora europaea CBS 101466]